MNSIELMAQDVKRQLDDLSTMLLPEPAQGRTLFAGSGDSYSAALAAHYLSSGRSLCYRPADIISDPTIAAGCSVYFVSISGMTKVNVLAAKSVRKAGAAAIAITADATSPLAAVCNSTFVLGFRSAGKTSGTISFTASLLACAQIAANITCPANWRQIYASAARKAAKVANNTKIRSVVMLGDSILYPAAMYGALKFSEVFGSRAAAFPLEDFCHAPLFGYRTDQVIVLGGKDSIWISRRLARAGLKILYVDCGRYDGLCSMLYAIFFMQHLVLDIAKKKKMKECYFLQDKKRLTASSDIIY